MTSPATWPVWWAVDQPDGSASILSVQPYTGRYPQHFTHVLRLAAPKTYRRWLEIAVNLPTTQHDPAMSTNPTVTCQHCLATRDCTLHPRASVPVEAAKRWLKAKCPGRKTIGTKCKFIYQCGIALSSPPRQ